MRGGTTSSPAHAQTLPHFPHLPTLAHLAGFSYIPLEKLKIKLLQWLRKVSPPLALLAASDGSEVIKVAWIVACRGTSTSSTALSTKNLLPRLRLNKPAPGWWTDAGC